MRSVTMFVLALGLCVSCLTGVRADNAVLCDTLANLRVDGMVYDAALQSDGKVIIGGNFDRVNDTDRQCIARLNADGTVDMDWDPKAYGSVYALAVDGSGIYAGGGFTNIGGQARNGVARLNETDGRADAWDPNADNGVYGIAVDSGSVYVGGVFTSIGGQARNRIARLNDTDGSADAWNPDANGPVWCLAVDGSGVYVGGVFFNVGGQARNYVARLDAGTGNADAWNPDSSDPVHVFEVDGGNIYAGGSFTNIGGQARNCLARLDAVTGNADAWNPNAAGDVYAFAVDGSDIYVAGGFTNIGGQARNYIARLDSGTGNADSWNPDSGRELYALALDGSYIYAGGYFPSMGGNRMSGFCKLDPADGGVVPGWDVACKFRSGAVGLDVAVQPDGKVVIGGMFTWVNDVSRYNIVRLNTDGTVDMDWDPNPSSFGIVNSVACDGSNIYVSGSFTNIGGQTRNYIARLNDADGAADSWDPSADNTVKCMTVDGSDLYVGGRFANIGGQARRCIARLNKENGVADTWDPGSNSEVYDIVADDTGVYACGVFTNIGGQARNRIARLDPVTGNADAWDANAHDWVNSLAVDGSGIYAAGGFTNIGGLARNYLARLSKADGSADTWDPNADNIVYTVALEGTNVYAGGSFENVGGQNRENLARLRSSDGSADTWNPEGNDNVYALAMDGTNCYTVGIFSRFTEQPRLGFAHFYLLAEPAAPSNVSASDGAYTDKITVTWNASDRAETYQVWRHTSDDTNAAVELVSDVTGTSFSDTNCLPSEIYYYWIKAVNPAGVSAWSVSDSGYCRSSGMAVYRFYSSGDPASTYTHLWTVNETERDVLIASPAWQYEGIGWYALTNMDSGAVPLYRLYEPNIRRHLYTVSDVEYVALTNTSWNGEGVQYFVYSTNSLSGLVPAYRFYNSGNQNHHFTVDENEKNTIIATPDWGYTYEGIGFYVAVTNTPTPLRQGVDPLLTQLNPPTEKLFHMPGRKQNPEPPAFENDVPAPGGETAGLLEKVVYCDSSGRWYLIYEADEYTMSAFRSGADQPFNEVFESELTLVPGDYNGDGVEDIALYDEYTGLWYIHFSDEFQILNLKFEIAPLAQWGGPGFVPVAMDYDGDGISDLAVCHETTGYWYITTLEGNILLWDGLVNL